MPIRAALPGGSAALLVLSRPSKTEGASTPGVPAEIVLDLPPPPPPLEWSPAMPGPSNHSAPPTPLVALAGWLIPGAGYFLIGHRTRALVVGVSVIVLFLLGILVAGIAVVEAPNFGGGGTVLGGILQK